MRDLKLACGMCGLLVVAKGSQVMTFMIDVNIKVTSEYSGPSLTMGRN